MKLYNYFRSSASYRVRIALAIKDLPFEYESVHLIQGGGQQHQPAYIQLNPLAEVPCLEHNGFYLTQSMAIFAYLDAIQPNPPLFPQEARARGKVIEFCEIINSGIQPFQNLNVMAKLKSDFGGSEEQVYAWYTHYIHRGLTALEGLLTASAKTYCCGEVVSAADAMLVPQIATAQRLQVPLTPFPKVVDIFERLTRLEVFIKAAPAAQPDAS